MLGISVSTYATDSKQNMSLQEIEKKAAFLPDIVINKKTLSKSNDPIVRDNIDAIVKEANKIENLNLCEINEYIDNEVAKTNNTKLINKARALNVNNKIKLKAMWLAAAQAAKIKGYPCSAKLIEYSVLGLDYNESKGKGGLFRDKIVTTKTYKNYLKAIKSGKKRTGTGYQLTHSKKENSDLYYSLHTCTYTAKKSGKNIK